MNHLKPIYTEKTRCQDCYKCLRHCPVKAIRVQDGSAIVMDDRCVSCGTCVIVCPAGAKKVRDDLDRARHLVRRKAQVYLSLAPSFTVEFPGLRPSQLIRAAQRLGFAGVSETALGADLVSQACAELLQQPGPGLHISTACPSAVALILKYHPTQAAGLTPLQSPLMAHCQLLRRAFGQDIGIVFAGPCTSKKLEADARPELLDVAITFQALRRWFEDEGVDPASFPDDPSAAFVPGAARDGALYPVDGGMLRTLEGAAKASGAQLMSFSGIPAVRNALESLDPEGLERPVFLELLACEGGCVNGPRCQSRASTVQKRLSIFSYAEPRRGAAAAVAPPFDLSLAAGADPIPPSVHSPGALQEALRRVGKTAREDELNCGGCGYDDCRAFASALLDGHAETAMCVSYMRRLALNKANALIRAMPAGAVIVDERMEIVECNRKFAELLGEQALLIYEARPGMGGARLQKVAPFHGLFQAVLADGGPGFQKDVRLGDRILRLSVFPIETGRVAGGVVQDITEPAVQRDQVISRAQDVIRKKVTTVQQIAYLLGENAAETEMLLGSIIQSFRPVSTQGPADPGDLP